MIGEKFSDEELRKRGIVTDESIGLLASTAAMRWPDRKFLHFEDEVYTFSELSKRIDQIAGDFLARGLEPGNRMFIQADNCVGALVTIMACWRIGIVPVPAISAYRRHELLQILDDTKPEAVATTSVLRKRYYLDEFDAILDEINHQPTVRYIVDGPSEKADWHPIPQRDDSKPAPEDLLLPPDSSLTALILFTSGTTSRPKGVRISAQSIITNTNSWIRRHDLNDSHSWYAAWPLAHIGALSTAVFTPLVTGAKTVMSQAWDANKAIRVIAEHEVYIIGASTVFLHDLIKAYKENPDVTYKLPAAGVGGAMTSPDLIMAAEEIGINAFRSFGMTELSGVGALARPDDPIELRANYDGLVHLGTQIDTVDDDRNPVGFGELGEIRIRGPQMLQSYTDPEATAAAIDDDGWLYTGDIGLIEESGWMKIAGRKKDIINRGGEKFSASDIEQAIASHGSIDEAAVLGVPDERLGERVGAFVVINEGDTWAGPEPILQHLENAQVAKIKHPVEWYVINEIPRTATGKVQKNALLDMHNKQANGES